MTAFAENINLLGKLDIVAENVSDKRQRIEGKNHILRLLTQCEFDEKCEIELIGKLEETIKRDPNLMYKGFLTYLKWSKSELERNSQYCNAKEKRDLRKKMAICYNESMAAQEKNPPFSRTAIDKFERQKLECLRKQIEPLAKEGNIFAQAFMSNIAEYFKDIQSEGYWLEQIEKKRGTEQYNFYFQCTELP
jgi:hypothetical protein